MKERLKQNIKEYGYGSLRDLGLRRDWVISRLAGHCGWRLCWHACGGLLGESGEGYVQ